MVRFPPQSFGSVVSEEGEFTSYTLSANLTYAIPVGLPSLEAIIMESAGKIVICDSQNKIFVQANLDGSSALVIMPGFPALTGFTKLADVYQAGSVLGKYYVVLNTARTTATVHKKGAVLQTIDFSSSSVGAGSSTTVVVSPSGTYIVVTGVDTKAPSNKGIRALIYQGS